jgi:RNA polymerase sigma-70 factor, ECF subfamily
VIAPTSCRSSSRFSPTADRAFTTSCRSSSRFSPTADRAFTSHLPPPVTFLVVERLKGTGHGTRTEPVSLELVERCKSGDEQVLGELVGATWLYRVATNVAISKYRSRKRRRSHETGVEDEALLRIPASGNVEEAAGARLEVRDVERALASLPEIYRGAVVLRDIYGLSIEEIASKLKITQTAAKVRVHRGRKKLKDTVFPEGPD